MTDLASRRRFYAEEIEVAANLTSPALIDAFATVARERFLPPGPWTIRSEADVQKPARTTRDDDPRHVYHNVAVAIDAARTLFNGAPSLLGSTIEALGLEAGDRVLHIGTGLGYYTAILGHVVGAAGHVTGIEVDAPLADRARQNLADLPWVVVRAGDASTSLDQTYEAILVNAGVTHPLPIWVDALTAGGRLMAPVTVAIPNTTIGKGPMVLFTRTDDQARLAARVVGLVAIYSALGVRDEAINAQLGQALTRSPFAPIRAWRRDAHEPSSSCWLHTTQGCFSLE
jgi:protein-L-isoaspartate(D-aspartate) O-methyltransferase